MATFIDVGFFGNFSIVFTFLFIWVLSFGLMEWRQPFGKDKKNLSALIAVSIAVIVVVSKAAVTFINYLIPWFLVLAIVVFFILFTVGMFIGSKDVSHVILQDRKITTWLIVITVVIVIFGLGKAFGSQTLEQGGWGGNSPTTPTDEFVNETGVGNPGVTGSQVATNDFSTNLTHTLFNPKVLGLILIMLVAVFAMFFITD